MSDETTTLWLPNQQMRERAEVPATTVAALEAVRGYMVPRYVENMPDGRRVGAFGERDIARVRDGYACGKCFAWFEQRFEVCPGCGETLDPGRDIVDHHPDYWEPYEGRTSAEILGGGPDGATSGSGAAGRVLRAPTGRSGA